MYQGARPWLVVLCFAGACCSQVATLGGAVVVAGGPAKVGVAQNPTGADPLALVGDPAECLPRASFDKLGPRCNEHQTQGGASPVMTDELTPGRHRTVEETAWYCREHTVVRLVLQRCDEAATYRVVDLAVSLGEKR